jgi:hypothetical protein
MRLLGKDMLSFCSVCFGLYRDLGTQPGYQQLVLPAAKLAWMLLHFEQQAAEAAGSSSNRGNSREAAAGEAGLAQNQHL